MSTPYDADWLEADDDAREAHVFPDKPARRPVDDALDRLEWAAKKVPELSAPDLAAMVRRAYPRMAQREGLAALDELVRRADRYQSADSPHNKVKPPRDGNHRGRDTTEVTVMPTKSNDTNDSPGRIVGVEDGDGHPWCFACADKEIREGGETAFLADVYAWDAKRRCFNCGLRIGEVAR